MWGGIKRFIGTTPGRITLVALAVLTVAGSFLYLGVFLSIPTFLLFGLALPIYTGWKRPRTLALAGLVVLLVSAPLASLVEAQALRSPSPAASSDNFLPVGSGGSVLQNARVSPFTGPGGGNYTFTVTVNPKYIPTAFGILWFASLYVSTCPGATGNSSPYCNPGYAFVYRNITFPANTTTPQAVTFSAVLHGSNIWWWQMSATARNLTTGVVHWIFLDPGNSYNAVQGPVSGDFLSTFEIVLPNLFVEMLFYLGSVFFFALLVYVFFKSREKRRKAEAEAMMPGPTSGPGTPAAGAPSPEAGGGAPKVKVDERACPKCGAVVYPGETTCWKCGAALNAVGAGPLPSKSP
jgi:hypothetical protein